MSERPEERDRKNRSLTRRSVPSSREQTNSFVNWNSLSGALGQPFDVTNIPLSKLYQMRKDPMIAFALMYIKVPLIRAPWHIESDSAQISSFVDNALRSIYGRLISQISNSLEFGYQAIIKQFEVINPQWEYLDQETQEAKKVWDDKIGALVWAPFIPLPPENVEPVWNSKGGLDGLRYAKTFGGGGKFLSNLNDDFNSVGIDHTLWFTNEKDSEFGSLYGYPRIGYAYRYWWSYWFAHALCDRHIEKDGDPAVMVRYPVDKFIDDNGDELDAKAIALAIGEDARSDSTVALPSSMVSDAEGRSTGKYEWDMGHLESGSNFNAFSERFNYLDVMKLRSIMVPENALVEGAGGCLLGDTPILMPRDHGKYPDGIPLKDVKPGQLVWSYNEEKSSFDLRPVKGVFKTMENAEVYKLTLDDGSEVIGTPDHPFMKRDGTWVEMIALEPGDQLMPLYEGSRSKYYDGRKAADNDYEPTIMLDPDNGKYLCEYRFIAQHFDWYGLSSDKINVHHIDNRHANTDISNLEPLTLSEHVKKHFADEHWKAVFSQKVKKAMADLDDEKRSRLAREHWSQEEWDSYKERLREPGREAMVGYLESLDEDTRKDFLSNRTKAGWENGSRDPSKYNWKVKDCTKCGSSYTPTHSVQKYCTGCVEQSRQEYIGRVKRGNDFASKECIKCSETFKPSSGNQKNCFNCMKVVVNHKVVSVEKCGREDVWDISIDGPEHCKNYVANGVVVHNTSSRNVASTMGDIFYESQAVMMSEIDDHINRYMIPQLVARNFPEFPGTVKKVTRGFSQADIALSKQLVQLIGQTDPSKLQIDVREVLKQAGVPLLSPTAIANEEKRIMNELEDVLPDDADPNNGKAGVKNGMYIDGREIAPPVNTDVDLSEFFANTPSVNSKLNNKFINKIADESYPLAKSTLDDIYKKASEVIGKQDDKLFMSEEEDEKKATDEIIKAVGIAAFIASFLAKFKPIQEKIMSYASSEELKKIDISSSSFDGTRPEAQDWIEKHGASLITQISTTTENEIRRFLADNFNQGMSPLEIATLFQEKFTEFSEYRSRAIVRSEIRDAYNAATLLAGQAEGVKKAKASDASGGRNINTDQHCIDRNGKVFSIKDALKEIDHTNGTLGWSLVPEK